MPGEGGSCGNGGPEAESHIRCRIALPPREKWNGEFWGVGNSSFGGVLPDTYGLSAAMNAVALSGRAWNYG